MSLLLALGNQISEFKANLLYLVRSRTTGAKQKSPSGNKTKK